MWMRHGLSTFRGYFGPELFFLELLLYTSVIHLPSTFFLELLTFTQSPLLIFLGIVNFYTCVIHPPPHFSWNCYVYTNVIHTPPKFSWNCYFYVQTKQDSTIYIDDLVIINYWSMRLILVSYYVVTRLNLY